LHSLIFIVDQINLCVDIPEADQNKEAESLDFPSKIEELEEENMLLRNELDLTLHQLLEADDVISNCLI
jgi:hypothetical protein